MIAGIIRLQALIKGGPYMRKYSTYCQLRFSSEIEVAQLGSARNLHSSAWLELENSGSGSSLQNTLFCLRVCFSSCLH